MKKNIWSTNPLPLYNAKSICKNRIGYLVDDFGNSLPGVTSILEFTRTPAEKARLANWRHRNSYEVNQVISLATRIGRMGHSQIENYFLGKESPCPELIQSHWKNLLPILEEIHELRLVEANLFHFYEGYAGRVDCVARYYDLPQCAIEFKFSDRIKPIYDETKLQLSAYIGGLNRQYGKPYDVAIKHGLIILATPDGVDLTLLDPKEIMEYWEKWQERVARFWAIRKVA